MQSAAHTCRARLRACRLTAAGRSRSISGEQVQEGRQAPRCPCGRRHSGIRPQVNRLASRPWRAHTPCGVRVCAPPGSRGDSRHRLLWGSGRQLRGLPSWRQVLLGLSATLEVAGPTLFRARQLAGRTRPSRHSENLLGSGPPRERRPRTSHAAHSRPDSGSPLRLLRQGCIRQPTTP